MLPGDVVAERFEIELCAGSGGMGVVYRARDRVSGGSVALKVLLGANEDQHFRFRREASVLADVRHPAVVQYVAHGVMQSGEDYLAMEWLDGEELATRLSREGLTIAESVALVARIAEGLGVAHARGVVHRDVKPSNIFLPGGDPLRAKILDFGVARLSRATRGTATGLMVGTPGYMAPEQARGSAGVDARADVFSLGCVLFECLTGRPAFLGEHVMAVLAKILFEDAPRLADVRDDVPEALDDLVARMLAKEVEARPAGGARLAFELENLGSLDGETRAKPTARPRALTRGELRMVSVVVAAQGDARHASPLAATLTPNEMSERLAPLRAAVEPFGARVERLMDGSVVATMADHGAATDQAARAARCALAIRAKLPASPMVLATGRAVVSERLPIGEVIEGAVRLVTTPTPDVDAAPPDPRPIRLDSVTAGLLDLRFDVRGRGKWLELWGERDAIEATRTLLGKPTACVGRERELSVLAGTFDECIAEPIARALLVTAAAGVGKSRLRYEFVRKIRERGEAVEVLVGRGDPMRVGSPLGMIAPALRRSAGILDAEPLLARRQKLTARIARHVHEGEARRVTDFIGELVGVPFPDDDNVQLRAARRDPMLMSDQMRRAFEDFLAAECRAQPVLLVLEDLHWGDLPSVHFVDAALRRLHDAPLMVLALARPEIHDLFPKLWAGREMQEIRLALLRRRAGEKLAR